MLSITKLRLIFAGALCVLTTSCATVFGYSANPITATIVDADTKQPVAGAVVVVTWTLREGVAPIRVKSLMVREATTDDRGQFRIDGWGPLAAPAGTYFDTDQPEIVVVKPGYLLGGVSNYVAMPPPRRPNPQTIDSVWNNHVIELAKDMGNKSVYNMRLGNYARLRVVFDSDDCQWKQIPNAVRAFQVERDKQVAYGVKLPSIPPLDHLLSISKCQPIDEFLEAYRGKK